MSYWNISIHSTIYLILTFSMKLFFEETLFFKVLSMIKLFETDYLNVSCKDQLVQVQN